MAAVTLLYGYYILNEFFGVNSIGKLISLFRGLTTLKSFFSLIKLSYISVYFKHFFNHITNLSLFLISLIAYHSFNELDIRNMFKVHINY